MNWFFAAWALAAFAMTFVGGIMMLETYEAIPSSTAGGAEMAGFMCALVSLGVGASIKALLDQAEEEKKDRQDLMLRENQWRF